MGRFMKFGRRNNSTITYTKDEPYAICFYLFNLFEEKSNLNVIEDNDEAIRLFLENTDRLNKNERLKAVLKAEIFRLEKQNKLKRLTDSKSNIMSFDDTDIPYVYEQDKKVERSMHRFNHPDEIIIDLHRVLYCSKESVFSSIINTVIFGKEDSLSLTPALNLSKKQKKSVFDVTKTKFLVDNVHLTEDEARYILMQCRFDTNDDLRSISRRNENEFRNTLPQMLGITKTTLLVCLLSMERKDSILIVDEADSLLQTVDFSFFGMSPSKSKGAVNKMLENNLDKVIFIINHQHQIDDSTLRRFTFSLHFESMPKTMMRNIAEQRLEGLDITDNSKTELVSMLNKYHLTGQSVENIVKTIDAMECKDEETLLKKAEIVMKENAG